MISFKERAVGNAVNGTCWLHIYLEGKDKIANPNLNKLLSKNGIASPETADDTESAFVEVVLD